MKKELNKIGKGFEQYIDMLNNIPPDEWERRDKISKEENFKELKRSIRQERSRIENFGFEWSEYRKARRFTNIKEYDLQARKYTGRNGKEDLFDRETNFDFSHKGSLILVGDYGTGKTLISHILGAVYLSQGKTIRLKEDIEIKRDATLYATGKLDLSVYLDPDYLVLDDLLSRLSYTANAIEFINDIIAYRTKKNKTTVITSNEIPTRFKLIPRGSDLKDPISFISTRVIDRMKRQFSRFDLNGLSKR